MVYVFDVDGTLTRSREAMESNFASLFHDFCTNHIVYLATGSDITKLEEQVPENIRAEVAGIFTCGGSQFDADGKTIYRHDHEFPDELIDWLDEHINDSKYPVRCGRHIEYRTGQLNASTLGRAATMAERQAYKLWDQTHNERASLCKDLMKAFPDYEAEAGGDISIDISPVGWNKSRIIVPVTERHGDVAITFAGDKIHPEGNDWAMAQALEAASPHHVIWSVEKFEDTAALMATVELANQSMTA